MGDFNDNPSDENIQLLTNNDTGSDIHLVMTGEGVTWFIRGIVPWRYTNGTETPINTVIAPLYTIPRPSIPIKSTIVRYVHPHICSAAASDTDHALCIRTAKDLTGVGIEEVDVHGVIVYIGYDTA